MRTCFSSLSILQGAKVAATLQSTLQNSRVTGWKGSWNCRKWWSWWSRRWALRRTFRFPVINCAGCLRKVFRWITAVWLVLIRRLVIGKVILVLLIRLRLMSRLNLSWSRRRKISRLLRERRSLRDRAVGISPNQPSKTSATRTKPPPPNASATAWATSGRPILPRRSH